MMEESRGPSVFFDVLGKNESICRVFPSQVRQHNPAIVAAPSRLRLLGLPQEAALTDLKE